MIEVARLPLDEDLSSFTEWLTRNGVPHRVVESEGAQTLILLDETHKEEVLKALNAFRNDPELREQLISAMANSKASPRRPFTAYDRVTPQQAPLVFIVIALCLLVAWLTGLGQGGPILRELLIVNPFDISANLSTMEGRWAAISATLAQGEFWRLITPDFLHFSILHITFNLLMFWVLGGQVEHKEGFWPLLNLILLVSIISNIAQLLDGGYLFGGLSGVVYGLFGYCWVWARYNTQIFMPDALFRFALVWLAIGYTPLTEWIGLGRMANSAHLYGLLSGLIWAWFKFGLLPNTSRNSGSGD